VTTPLRLALRAGLALLLLVPGAPLVRPWGVDLRARAWAAEDGALDAVPAPRREAKDQGGSAPPAAELPPAARSGAFRAASHPPADVPPAALVRSAKKPARGRSVPEKSGHRPGGAGAAEGSSVEIIWHAPGSGP
jgi:hypothetical protein